MADVKGVFKENQKLFLSILGIIILALIMGSAGSQEGGFFELWNLETTGTNSSSSLNVVGVDGGTVVDPNVRNNPGQGVSNGKNGIYGTPPEMTLDENTDYSATINTSTGSIQVDLYETLTPITVNNFVFLADQNFYAGTSFHRVDKDFVIQGGDPLGTGYGGPGYAIQDEIVSTLTFKPFVIAMANGAPNTNGSQFFITTRFSNTASLNGKYTIFGQVTSGYDVIDAIELVNVDSNKMPVDPILINSVTIHREQSL